MPRAAAISAPERRAHAVRVLLELARQTAPDQISTAAIAERMGLSHGALFRHFPTREALWAEAVRWAIRQLDGPLDTPASAAPLAEVEALLHRHACLMADNPGLVRMLFAELQRPGTSEAREAGKAFMQRFRARLAVLLAAARAEAGLDPRLDPPHWAALLVATQQGLILQALAHDEFSELPERARGAISLLLKMASGAVPATPPGA